VLLLLLLAAAAAAAAALNHVRFHVVVDAPKPKGNWGVPV